MAKLNTNADVTDLSQSPEHNVAAFYDLDDLGLGIIENNLTPRERLRILSGHFRGAEDGKEAAAVSREIRATVKEALEVTGALASARIDGQDASGRPMSLFVQRLQASRNRTRENAYINNALTPTENKHVLSDSGIATPLVHDPHLSIPASPRRDPLPLEGEPDPHAQYDRDGD